MGRSKKRTDDKSRERGTRRPGSPIRKPSSRGRTASRPKERPESPPTRVSDTAADREIENGIQHQDSLVPMQDAVPLVSSLLTGTALRELLTLLRKIDERPAPPAAGGDEPRDSAPAGEVDASGRHGDPAHDGSPTTRGAGTEPLKPGETPSGQEPSDPAQDG